MLNFLTLQPQAFGLDISELSLKTAMLKKNKKGFAPISLGLEKIKAGVIENGEVRNQKILTETIKKALENVRGRPIKMKYVIFSLPEEKSFLEVIQLPKMAKEDLKNAVKFEAENYIPLPLDKVYFDFQEIKPVCNSLDHFDILLVSLPRETVDPYISCLKSAGLQPIALEVESQAIARALIKEEISTNPILLIDFGETRTSFIVWAGRSVRFTSTIPISSQKFTQAIADTLKINKRQAEKMKTKYGFDVKNQKKTREEKNVFEALVPIMTDLVEQIKNCLDYYQTHAQHEHLPPDGKGIEKILVCGGDILPGIASFISSELKLPVVFGNPLINFGLPKKTIAPVRELLGYTTALGLALRGAK